MLYDKNWFSGATAALACSISGVALLIPSAAFAQATVTSPKTATTRKNAGEATVVTKKKALFRDFMGRNVHSVGFKPELYKPVCRLVRDYHPMVWDLGDDTGNATQFPMTRNNINWLNEYGVWNKTGYAIDVSLQFEQTAPNKWKDMPKDAFAYGRSFAQYFGPSGIHPLIESVEIGNEPGNYSDAEYRTVFENMARGIREGDPHLPIATCNVVAGKPDKYTKNIDSLDGLQSLYDIINIHTYAFAEPYPTWRRSYPEDPSIKYLPPVTDTIAWRNAHASGKQIWITEFGWDTTTKPNLPTGDFSRWVGVTDTQQAQYLVRSFLICSALDVDRAYIYYYDDQDAPTLHASSGLTRNFTPKPSFYAVSHLYATLGDYRFVRAVVQETGSLYAYEYQNGTNSKDRIWAVWSPTGKNRETEVVLRGTCSCNWRRYWATICSMRASRSLVSDMAASQGRRWETIRQTNCIALNLKRTLADKPYRQQLIDASVNGAKWTVKGKSASITDREMVELAQSLHGWTQSVYKFGCAFIHLSSFHDYEHRDPLLALPKDEKADILKHMQAYHGGPTVAEATFEDLLPYLPAVFEKVAGNLKYYVEQLEAEEAPAKSTI